MEICHINQKNLQLCNTSVYDDTADRADLSIMHTKIGRRRSCVIGAGQRLFMSGYLCPAPSSGKQCYLRFKTDVQFLVQENLPTCPKPYACVNTMFSKQRGTFYLKLHTHRLLTHFGLHNISLLGNEHFLFLLLINLEF